MLFIEFAIIILLVRKCDLCYVNDNTDMNLIIFRWLLLVILLQIIIDFFSYIFFRLFISDFLYDMFCTFSWWCKVDTFEFSCILYNIHTYTRTILLVAYIIACMLAGTEVRSTTGCGRSKHGLLKCYGVDEP